MHSVRDASAVRLERQEGAWLSGQPRRIAPILFMLAALPLITRPVHAAPLVGAPFVTSVGGSHQVEILQPEAGFTMEIQLVAPVNRLIGLSTEVGKVVQLGQFLGGAELVFAIRVLQTGDVFFTGPASRNPDNVAHAFVDFVSPVQAVVGFEDLFGGGDLDYNDALFAVTAFPEPNHALMEIEGAGDRATLTVGQCITLHLEVRFKGTSTYVDVTESPNTTFFTDPPRGAIRGNVFCASAADVNRTFTIYGRYTDPVTGVSVTDTVIVTVRPN